MDELLLYKKLRKYLSIYPDRKVIFIAPSEMFVDYGEAGIGIIDNVVLDDMILDEEISKWTWRYWFKSDREELYNTLKRKGIYKEDAVIKKVMDDLIWCPVILVYLKISDLS